MARACRRTRRTSPPARNCSSLQAAAADAQVERQICFEAVLEFDAEAQEIEIELGLWADLLIIAPISANTLAKLSTGICDNLLTAVYLSAKCPVYVAPAMDLDMWKHESTQQNIERIRSFGNTVISPENGELASGLVGEGRMAQFYMVTPYTSFFFEVLCINRILRKGGKCKRSNEITRICRKNYFNVCASFNKRSY